MRRDQQHLDSARLAPVISRSASRAPVVDTFSGKRAATGQLSLSSERIERRLHAAPDELSHVARLGVGRDVDRRQHSESDAQRQGEVGSPRSDGDPPRKRERERKSLETRPSTEGDRTRYRRSVVEYVRGAMRTVNDDGHYRRSCALRDASESGSLAEHDSVALAAVSIRLEVATRIDQRLPAALEHAPRVLRARPYCTDFLQFTANRRDVSHDEVVRERVERRVGASSLQQRCERASQVGAGDSAVVVRHEECGTIRDVLEAIAHEAQIVAVERAHRGEQRPDERRVALIEAVGIEGSHDTAPETPARRRALSATRVCEAIERTTLGK